MNAWKTAGAAAALAAATGLGAAIAPAGRAQTATRVAPRALDVLGGRGSQIGVSIRDLRDDDKGAQAGVVVEEVSADSPAEKGGIKKGDIITEFDGERVRSVRQFTRLVQETPAGRKTPATVMRDGQRVTVSVEPRESSAFGAFRDLDGLRVFGDLGRDFDFAFPTPAVPPAPQARPGTPVPPAAPAPPVPPDFQSFIWRSTTGLGITVSDLSTQLAEYFGAKDGVLVTAVTENSAGAKAGLKAGDVITSFNGGSVTNPADLRRRIQRLDVGDEFTIGIVRDKKPQTLKGKYESSRPIRTSRTIV
jgi:S1-C subfamily serine protease